MPGIGPLSQADQPIMNDIRTMVEDMSKDQAKERLFFKLNSNAINYEHKESNGEREKPEIKIKQWNTISQNLDPMTKFEIELLVRQAEFVLVDGTSQQGGKKHKKRTSKKRTSKKRTYRKGPSRKNKRKVMKNKSRRHRK